MTEELFILNPTSGEYVSVGFTGDNRISIDYQISDVRDPESVKSSKSKTIVIPGTKEVNLLFEMIFETNIQTQNFNVNLKTPVKQYIEGELTFDGDLQLLQINTESDGNNILSVEYECSLLGEVGNIFLAMGDKYITGNADPADDIDFSDLDHTFSFTPTMFAPANIGEGYAYGFTDYGFSGGITNTWKFTDLKVGIFEREYLRRIFSKHGYSWDSDFLDSAYYKRRIIPDTNEGKMKVSQAVIDNAAFYAGKTADTNFTINGAYNPSASRWEYANVLQDVGLQIFNDESTPPFGDPGNNYASNIYTVGVIGYYQFKSNCTYTITVNPPAGTASVAGVLIFNLYLEIQLSTNNGASWSILGGGAQSGYQVNINSLGPYTSTITVETASVNRNVNDKFRVFLRTGNAVGLTFLNGSNVPITSGTSSITVVQESNSVYFGGYSQTDLLYGQTVAMNQTLPKLVKQKDLFKSIINSYKLMIEPDKNYRKKLIIEPYIDFYLNPSQALDWTDKEDLSTQRNVIPMGELDFRSLTLQYKSDDDFYNKDYQDNYKQTYGTEIYNVNNDFIKSDKKVELIFSPTPLVQMTNSTMIVPKIYKNESNSIKNVKANIRVLYWGGLMNCTTFNWNVNGSVSLRSDFPYWGHVDNPNSPTKDLCFDNPLRLYWNLPAQVYTTDSLGNRYWYRYINEVTDPDSKIIKMNLYLTPVDIKSFSFRKPVFIKDAYFYVNKIIGYNPLVNQTTSVELLKIKQSPAFNMGQVDIGDDVDIVNLDPDNNGEGNVGLIIGQGNNDPYQASLIIGNGNVIGYG